MQKSQQLPMHLLPNRQKKQNTNVDSASSPSLWVNFLVFLSEWGVNIAPLQRFQLALAPVGRGVSRSTAFTADVLKTTAYWSGVAIVGLFVTGTVMALAGLPIFEPVPAYSQVSFFQLGFTDSIFNMIVFTNTIILWILYYAFALLGSAMAIIMQAVINYPHGAFWTFGTGTTTPVGFVNVEAVITGWKLVRDICNIFFSVILVIIALATVLKIESYAWKQTLGKFVIYAILINFSKSICGIFTDVATVAMATFAGAFGQNFAVAVLAGFDVAGPGGLVEFGDASDSQKVAEVVKNSSFSQIFGATLVAMGIAAASALIFFIITAVLLIRIVMIWFLIVLSPIAYITRILPITKRYSSQWWEMFGRWVLLGPLVAFFLWLSLTMIYGGSGNPIDAGFDQDTFEQNFKQYSNLEATPSSPYAATSPNILANFMLMAMMFAASFKIIKDSSKEAGAIVGKLPDAGKAALQFPGRLATKAGSSLARRGGRTAAFGRGLTAAGAVFQPYTMASNAWSNIRGASKNKQKNEQREIANVLGGLASAKIVGADGEKSNLRALGNFLGKGLSIGLEDNADEVGRTLSTGQLAAAYRQRRAYKDGDYKKRVDMSNAISEAEEELRIGELHKSAADASAAATQAAADEANIAGHSAAAPTTVSVDASDAEVVAVIQEKLDKMKQKRDKLASSDKHADQAMAATMSPAIDNAQQYLDTQLKDGKDVSLSTVLGHMNTAGGNHETDLKGRLERAYSDRARKHIDTRDQKRADATTGELELGVGLGALSMSDSEIDKRKAALRKDKQELSDLSSRLEGYGPGPGNKAASLNSAAVAEKKKLVAGLGSSDKLLERLQMAKQQGDRDLYEAVIERMQETGNMQALHDLVPDDAKDADGKLLKELDADGNVITSGAGALEAFRKYDAANFLGEGRSLGMASRIAGNSHDYLYAYKSDFSGTSYRKEGDRERLAAALADRGSVDDLKKVQVSSVVKKTRNAAGLESTTLDPVILRQLKAFSGELADKRTFNSALPASVRRELSKPANIQRLRQAGLSSAAIANFVAYGRDRS